MSSKTVGQLRYGQRPKGYEIDELNELTPGVISSVSFNSY